MNKSTTFLLLSLIALLGMTVTASGAAPKQQAGTQHGVTIFFANDVRGETEPCG